MRTIDSRITQFVEKGVSTGRGLINAGAYLLRKAILCDLPESQAMSLERDVFPRILDRGVYGVVCAGLFIDIGIPDDFQRAQDLLASRGRVSRDPSAPASHGILGGAT